MADANQQGCFVPATFASFRLVDKIFTRIGTADSVENNCRYACYGLCVLATNKDSVRLWLRCVRWLLSYRQDTILKIVEG